jgi:hypothetical protein
MSEQPDRLLVFVLLLLILLVVLAGLAVDKILS